jgi:hypothetical protein
MWTNEIAPERLAELFHHYQQALTPVMPVNNGEERQAWKEMPQPERRVLVAAARLTLLELDSVAHEVPKPRKYFAQPGEAEWGC